MKHLDFKATFYVKKRQKTHAQTYKKQGNKNIWKYFVLCIK